MKLRQSQMPKLHEISQEDALNFMQLSSNDEATWVYKEEEQDVK